MKKLYVFASCIFFTAMLTAQPTLQYPQNVPEIGDVMDIQCVSTNGLTTGTAGPDVSWDYSGLITISGGQIIVVDPSQTPSGNEFPSATFATSMGDTIFTYAQTNADGYFYLGSESTTGTFSSLLVYSDSRTFVKFPFTYDDTYFDTYKGIVTTSAATVHVTAASEMFADSYGTLILPNGTYTNVLRIITIDAEIDSLFMEGNFIMEFSVVRTQFTWFAPDSKGPLLSIEILDNAGLGSIDTVAFYSSAESGIIDGHPGPVSHLSVFPNPAEDHVVIEFNALQHTGISISIVNQVGQMMISKKTANDHTGSVSERIDVSTLPSGIYFAHISCDCGKHLTEKFVIR